MPVAGRAAIVGAGIMGLATARALARRGWDVTIYEQFEVGHKRGSSHGRSRIFRLAYPDPEWVRLATDALRGWRDLEEESGTALLELNGLLEMVRVAAGSSRDGLRKAGVEFELVDAAAAERRWPIRVPQGWTVLFQPEAGIVRADLAQRAFLDSAREHGAELREKTLVESLDDVDADVTVAQWTTHAVQPALNERFRTREYTG